MISLSINEKIDLMKEAIAIKKEIISAREAIDSALDARIKIMDNGWYSNSIIGNSEDMASAYARTYKKQLDDRLSSIKSTVEVIKQKLIASKDKNLVDIIEKEESGMMNA